MYTLQAGLPLADPQRFWLTPEFVVLSSSLSGTADCMQLGPSRQSSPLVARSPLVAERSRVLRAGSCMCRQAGSGGPTPTSNWEALPLEQFLIS